MKIVAESLNEYLNELSDTKFYTIKDLAETLSNKSIGDSGYDDDTLKIIYRMLKKAFRRGGDQAVIDYFNQMGGVQIQSIRPGRYVFNSVTKQT